jgi:hypothetical protein
MTRIAIYTCVTCGYDHIAPPAEPDSRLAYHAWSDRPETVPAPWAAHRIDLADLGPKDQNRYAKMHPHLLPVLAGFDVSVYVDGSIDIVGDVHALVSQCLQAHPDTDLFLYAHPFRDCVYDEARACAGFGHAHALTLRRQMGRYRREGLPAHVGLYECNVLIRRHTPKMAQAMDIWWQEYRQHAKRDQLAITWAIWSSGLRVTSLGPSDPRNAQRFFRLKPHAKAGFSARMTSIKWANRLLQASGLAQLPTEPRP